MNSNFSGVFVRIKEKNLHVECFKCATCGSSLKNVGYYNINNKLYCDIHAKMVARQQAPPGMVPVTVPPCVFRTVLFLIISPLMLINIFFLVLQGWKSTSRHNFSSTVESDQYHVSTANHSTADTCLGICKEYL